MPGTPFLVFLAFIGIMSGTTYAVNFPARGAQNPFLVGGSPVTYRGIIKNGWQYYTYLPAESGKEIGNFAYAGYSTLLQHYTFGLGMMSSHFFPTSWEGPFTGNTVLYDEISYAEAFNNVWGSSAVNTSYPPFASIPNGTHFGWSHLGNVWVFLTPTDLYYTMTFNPVPGTAVAQPYSINVEHFAVIKHRIKPELVPAQGCVAKLSLAWNPTTYAVALSGTWMHYRWMPPTEKLPMGYFSYVKFPSFVGQQQPGQSLNGKPIYGEGRVSLYNFGSVHGPYAATELHGQSGCSWRPGTCTCTDFTGVWSQISGLGQLQVPLGELSVGTEFGWSHDANQFVFRSDANQFYTVTPILNVPFMYPYTIVEVSSRRPNLYRY